MSNSNASAARYEGIATIEAHQYGQSVRLTYAASGMQLLNRDVQNMVLLLRLTANQLERGLPEDIRRATTLAAALREMVKCYKEEGVPTREQPTLIRNAVAALDKYTSANAE